MPLIKGRTVPLFLISLEFYYGLISSLIIIFFILKKTHFPFSSTSDGIHDKLHKKILGY